MKTRFRTVDSVLDEIDAIQPGIAERAQRISIAWVLSPDRASP